MNHYNYCWNRPLDLVDLNGMEPTAGVIKDLEEMYPDNGIGDEATTEVEMELDIVHKLSETYNMEQKLKDAGELGKDVNSWGKQYSLNRSMMKTLETTQETEMKALQEGVSVGKYRRATRAGIKDGLEGMEEIGELAKKSSKMGSFATVAGIGIDVSVGIYDNYQSGASATEYVSDATVDVALSTGEVAVSSAAATGSAILATSIITGMGFGSVVPGLGNILGAIIGFGVGLALMYVDQKDWNGDGKSLRDDIKDDFYEWISGGSNEKE